MKTHALGPGLHSHIENKGWRLNTQGQSVVLVGPHSCLTKGNQESADQGAMSCSCF